MTQERSGNAKEIKPKKKRGNIANLKPFKKGQSGNPKGGRKGPQLGTILMKVLKRRIRMADPLSASKTPKKTSRTVAEQITLKLAEKALSGDVRAITEVLDRIDGKTKLPIGFENPLELEAYALNPADVVKHSKKLNELIKKNKK